MSLFSLSVPLWSSAVTTFTPTKQIEIILFFREKEREREVERLERIGPKSTRSLYKTIDWSSCEILQVSNQFKKKKIQLNMIGIRRPITAQKQQ